MAEVKSTVDERINQLQFEIEQSFSDWQSLMLQKVALLGLTLFFFLASILWVDRLFLIAMPCAILAGVWITREENARTTVDELHVQMRTLMRAKNTTKPKKG